MVMMVLCENSKMRKENCFAVIGLPTGNGGDSRSWVGCKQTDTANKNIRSHARREHHTAVRGCDFDKENFFSRYFRVSADRTPAARAARGGLSRATRA
ncbi:MAG: hypothetical protein PHI18_09580, partial [bacterium]|nr:hypothetical protein [bacterium]